MVERARTHWVKKTALAGSLSVGLMAGGYGIATAATSLGAPASSGASASAPQGAPSGPRCLIKTSAGASLPVPPSSPPGAPAGTSASGGSSSSAGTSASGGSSSSGTTSGPVTSPSGAPGIVTSGVCGPQVTVTAITANSLTFAGPRGTTTTVILDASTTYSVQGQPSTASSVAVGDHVLLKFATPPSSGSEQTATNVNVLLAGLGGTVQSVTGSSGSETIVVADGDGFWRTIQTSAATTYTDAGAAVTDPTITAGEMIQATGSIDSNHTTLDATSVNIGAPNKANGPVTMQSGGGYAIAGGPGALPAG